MVCNDHVGLWLYMGSSSAKAALQRRGVERLEHLNVRHVWAQQMVKRQYLQIFRVPTTYHVADCHVVWHQSNWPGESLPEPACFQNSYACRFEGLVNLLWTRAKPRAKQRNRLLRNRYNGRLIVAIEAMKGKSIIAYSFLLYS